MPNVHFSFRRGAGDVPEILYGKVEIKPTLAFARGTSLVLPAPTTLDLVNGEATANNVYPTPAPVGGEIEWAYRVKAIDTRGHSFEWMVGVPDSTGTVEFTSLPRYFETKPPLFGKGEKGDPGEAATIQIGTTASGSTPSVTNSGTNQNAVLDFVLPKGDKGDRGDGVPAGGSDKQLIQKTGDTTVWVSPEEATPLASEATAGLLEAIDQRLLLNGVPLGAANLNNIIAPGKYQQQVVSNVTPENNYPLAGASCRVEVFEFHKDGLRFTQEASYVASGRKFTRYTSNGGVTWSAWVEYARISDVTSAIQNIPVADDVNAGLLPPGELSRLTGTFAIGSTRLNALTTPGSYNQNNISYVRLWNDYPVHNTNTQVDVIPLSNNSVAQKAYIPLQGRWLFRRQSSSQPNGWTPWEEINPTGVTPMFFSEEQRPYPAVLTNTSRYESISESAKPQLVRNGNTVELSGRVRVAQDGAGASFTSVFNLPPDAKPFDGGVRYFPIRGAGGKNGTLYIGSTGTVQIFDMPGMVVGESVYLSASWGVKPSSPYSFTRINSRMFEGTDYSRTINDLGTWLSVVCVHGGEIEPGTSEIGKAIKDQLGASWYEWDIKTSTVLGQSAFDVGHELDGNYQGCVFDDVGMVEMVKGSEDCIAFHGAADGNSSNGRPAGALTCVGGDNLVFGEIIANHLNAAGFPALNDHASFPTLAGTGLRHPHNHAKNLGVQLELSVTQRKNFFSGNDYSRPNRGNITPAFTAYKNAILAAIAEYRAL